MHKEPTTRRPRGKPQFLQLGVAKGDKMAEDLDYIPMPDAAVKLIEKTWTADIKS